MNDALGTKPKKDKKKEKELPGWRKSGFGLSWGRVVHYILEVAGKGEDEKLDLLAENALVAEERDAGEKGKKQD